LLVTRCRSSTPSPTVPGRRRPVPVDRLDQTPPARKPRTVTSSTGEVRSNFCLEQVSVTNCTIWCRSAHAPSRCHKQDPKANDDDPQQWSEHPAGAPTSTHPSGKVPFHSLRCIGFSFPHFK
jgi:hypothetical protein